jgi:pimeloyl-ACP methyl ester carboxylesterase
MTCARLAVPTLFVWGAREPYGPVDVAHRVAAAMPDARVETIADAWHRPWLADPSAPGRIGQNFLATRHA